jgi:cell division protein FtsQ
LRLQLPMLALASVGIIAFLVFAGLARPLKSPAPALAEIERIIELAGFGLTQVSLTGHRYTLDSDVFDAVRLETARTVLSFDSRAAQDRIERLPWVERASIERVLPDRLEVHISERFPYAVWQLGSRSFLIDKSGRVLTAVPGDAMPSLPRVAGEGAATEAAGLFALLAGHPALMARVSIARRVGGRRWSLWLADGGIIQLPARGEAEALARALQIAGARGFEVREIDVRTPERTLVRELEVRKENMEQEGRTLTGGI